MLHDPQTLQIALDQLKSNPVLAPLVAAHPAPSYTLATDHFQALARIIVFQQLSGKAASTIYSRLENLTQGPLTPGSILVLSIEEMRSAGVSRQKASYLQNLADHFATNKIHGQNWPHMSDEEIKAEITAVKGLGDWCADMTLMFSLCRPDVWPVGDQGIRNAAKYLTHSETHLSKSDLLTLAEPFRPYRTVAAHYFWRAVDTKAPKSDE